MRNQLQSTPREIDTYNIYDINDFSIKSIKSKKEKCSDLNPLFTNDTVDFILTSKVVKFYYTLVVKVSNGDSFTINTERSACYGSGIFWCSY